MPGDKYIIRDRNAMHFLTFTVTDRVDVFTGKENNPVRAMIVNEAFQYVFSSAKDYADESGLINITKI